MTGQSPKKYTIVIGLGNELLSDEGVGVHLVRQLAGQKSKFPAVDFIEAGSAGMNLLHLIANRRKAIIIDCARMGSAPGTIRRFTIDEIESVKKLTNYSLHEADILQIINLSGKLGECPGEIVLFGIEPRSLEPGQKLSPTLSAKFDSYLANVREELS